MDIHTPRRPVAPPPAGVVRLIYEDGHVRAIDPNGRKLRMRPERGTPVHATSAEWGLTVDTQPEVGDELFFGSSRWTFVDADAGAGEILIGETVGDTQAAIVLAIDASGTHTAADFVDDESLVSSVSYGAASNVAFGITATGGNSITAGTVGIDATEGSAGDQMYDDSYLYTACADITKTSYEGWANVVFN